MSAQLWNKSDLLSLERKKVKTYSKYTLSWIYRSVMVVYIRWWIQFNWSNDILNKNDTIYTVIKFYAKKWF